MEHTDHAEVGESEGGAPAGHPVGHEGTRVDVTERPAWSVDGFAGLAVSLVLLGLGGWLTVLGIIEADAGEGGVGRIVGGLAIGTIALLLSASLAVVAPGQTRVVQFFGKYVGTVRKPGLRMVVPLTTRRNVSVRVHNFETHELKVNDADGNPVNIAAIVVWQVADTARAKFAVEDYEDFVAVQAESALRHVAMSHPYDNAATEVTLRGDTEVISAELAAEVAERIALAGLEIIEVRISALAYAPEIAQAMLQRQQASAVVAARETIVDGAVGMVESALAQLEQKDIVELDSERKAAMVSNLLTVLCSERGTTPVVNTGSLYT
ncbi:regulator of protease activity HflC (stomatin/prohibitin superfamily) [Nocardioides cavernae]|uniref:Regulator of protease activity HflC (Stomatin/prohibitin superfamily) n=1 Tax=Nocardioides cavernae TaxID=1921566 RepID=A0A7Y9KNF4_9ACTN|nr:SPFH domain-containing protein [Nocardioides cavernae]NYE35636.1 regulator of protease activity HflC (stomatin/prohibitin superfamily) [Nocardioides cavernae]